MRAFLSLMRLNEVPRSALISVSTAGTSIPKIVHQTYLRPPSSTDPATNIKAIFAENVAAIQRLNPDWRYRFYDNDAAEQFIVQNYGEQVFQLYDRIDARYGAAKADLFRYLLLYRLGGVYLDMKSTIDRPFDRVIRPDDVYLLSQWHNKPGEQYEDWGVHDELSAIGLTEFQQWHVICAPGHPFLKAVIEAVLRNIRCYTPLHGFGKSATLRVTGPIAYTLAISPLLASYPHRFMDAAADGLRYSIFDNDRSETHRKIMPFHYSQHEAISLVRIGFLKRSLLPLPKAVRATRRAGRRIRELRHLVR